MALERQSIEKKDFPIGRRGYDPDAVDAHLKSLADEVDELKRSSRKRTETLASTASEQVRAIVEVAETSANEIQRQAEEDALEIRAEAGSEAASTREQATTQAREYVGKVSESTSVMLQRLDAMESELSALIESLRTGSNRLNADLQLLETNLADVRGSTMTPSRFEPEPDAGVADEPDTAAHEAGPAEEAAPAEAGADEAAQPHGEAAAAEPAHRESRDGGAEDTEGARLIALNMALNGTPRDETERYLAENFELSDRAGLLDEVYTSVEG